MQHKNKNTLQFLIILNLLNSYVDFTPTAKIWTASRNKSINNFGLNKHPEWWESLIAERSN